MKTEGEVTATIDGQPAKEWRANYLPAPHFWPRAEGLPGLCARGHLRRLRGIDRDDDRRGD